MMRVCYPALFYYDRIYRSYFVNFPDFEYFANQGKSITESIENSSDSLGYILAKYIENDREIPKASDINTLSLLDYNPLKDDPDLNNIYNLDQSFVSFIYTNVSSYLEEDID